MAGRVLTNPPFLQVSYQASCPDEVDLVQWAGWCSLIIAVPPLSKHDGRTRTLYRPVSTAASSRNETVKKPINCIWLHWLQALTVKDRNPEPLPIKILRVNPNN